MQQSMHHVCMSVCAILHSFCIEISYVCMSVCAILHSFCIEISYVCMSVCAILHSFCIEISYVCMSVCAILHSFCIEISWSNFSSKISDKNSGHKYFFNKNLHHDIMYKCIWCSWLLHTNDCLIYLDTD